jgi:3-oxoacyl-(acyl-carrier-protein) synthase/NAD(P)-dependent dehydrogenase (short-subunit alcohol dehydrogenase family)/acyl carrier protein
MSYKFQITDDPSEIDQAVAVIGLGALFPGRPGLAGFWSTIRHGRDTITQVPPDHFNPNDYYDPNPRAKDKMYCRRGAFLAPVAFEPLKFGITPRDLESIDSTQLLGLIVADAALNDAGYPADRTDHSRTAVIMGVTGGLEMLGHMSNRMVYPQIRRALEAEGLDDATISSVLEKFGDQFAPWREVSFPGLLGNVTAGRLANRLNLGGANMVVDAACASSLAAVGQALLELRAGRSDMVVVGGVDTFTDPFMFTCFCKTPALSPTEDIRSFDQAGDGTMLGEGLGILILKRLHEALKDKDRLYAIIRGVGGASDGRGTAIFAPSAQGQLRAMKAAFQEAKISPDTVELIEGHGTSTYAGDTAEINALGELYSQHRPKNLAEPWCALGSIKAQIGHAKAAAGIAGLIKVILSLYNKVLPPSIKVKNPLAPLAEPDSPIYVNSQARPWLTRAGHPRRASVSAFGFGGSNFHCLVEEGPFPKPPMETGQHLIPLSGPDGTSLMPLIEELAWIKSPDELDFKVKELYKTFNPLSPVRLTLAGSFEELSPHWPQIIKALAAYEKGAAPHWPQGTFWSAGAPEKSLSVFVTDQMPIPHLGRDLALSFPSFQRVLDLAGRYCPLRLSQILFPPELASQAAKNNWHQQLQKSPFLGTVLTLAQSSMWSSLGLVPDSVTGHGRGLLAAARLAGCISLEEAVKVAVNLGEDLPCDHLKSMLNNTFLSEPSIPLRAGQEITAISDLKKALLENLSQTPDDPKSSAEQLPSFSPKNPLLVIGQSPVLPAGYDLFGLDEAWSTGSLAKNLARLASLGQVLDLEKWPVYADPEKPPQGHFVLLSGANYFNSQKVRTQEPLKPLKPQTQKNITDPPAAVTEGSIQEILKIQSESLNVLKDLVREMILTRTSGQLAAGQPAATDSTYTVTVPLAASPLAASPLATHPLAAPPAANSPDSMVSPAVHTAAAALSPDYPDQNPEPLTVSSSAAVWPILTQILAAETGYPADSLTENLDLEEDLGLDSIKRMEILAVLADRFPQLQSGQNLPKTLGELALLCAETAAPSDTEPSETNISRLLDSALTKNQTGQSWTEPETFKATESPTLSRAQVLREVLAQETGYPIDSFKPEMDLEADLGLDSIKRVEILSVLADRLPGLDPASLSSASTLGQLIEEISVSETAADDDPDSGSDYDSDSGSDYDSEPESESASSDTDESAVIMVVARETGYPPELLKPEMELENDLGLDSIKKVEILSILAESRPDLGTNDQAILAGALTLGDWLDFFQNSASQTKSQAQGQAKTQAQNQTNSQTKSQAKNQVHNPAQSPPQNQPINIDIDPAAQNCYWAEKEAVLNFQPQSQTQPQTQTQTLTQTQRPGQVKKSNGNGRMRKGNGRSALPDTLISEAPSLFQVSPEIYPPEDGPSPWPLHGLVRLVGSGKITASLDKELQRQGYETDKRNWDADLESWRGDKPADVLMLIWPGQDRSPQIITQALKALDVCGPDLKAIAGLSFLGGSFGFPEPSKGIVQGNSISGALVGLLKCAAREWPKVFTRILDLPLAVFESPSANWISKILYHASEPGPMELGLSTLDRLITLKLKPYLPKQSPEPLLNPHDTVVVTGGGRGVTAAVLLEMSKLYKPQLIILGRTPLAPTEPAWLADLKTDQEIKAALHQAGTLSLTPKEINKQMKLILSARELRNNLALLAQTGSKVEYICGDFTQNSVLEDTARQIRARFGPIRGFIHGAGILADHPILGKNHEDFAKVYATKTQIAANFLEAFQPEPLKLVVFFSSSTARFGRQGQSDYAAGNEVLNKTAWELSVLHPRTRVLAVNWGPWAGGMVNNTLADQFQAQGVGLIGLKQGAETFVRLIRSPVGDPAEVVVLGQGTNLEALDAYARGPA